MKHMIRIFAVIITLTSAVQFTKAAAGVTDSVAPAQNLLQETYGIELVALRLTAADYMLDMRYKVLDPEKAKGFMNKDIHPYLRHTVSDSRLFTPSSPKTGSLRTSSRAPATDRQYFAMFANPGRFVKTGDTLQLYVKDTMLAEVKVQ